MEDPLYPQPTTSARSFHSPHPTHASTLLLPSCSQIHKVDLMVSYRVDEDGI